MVKQILRRSLWPLLVVSCSALTIGHPARVSAQPPASVIRTIEKPTERMEITVNSSRRLRLDQTIHEVDVHNPDLLDVTPLSPNEIQVFAKKTGVTQIYLWGDNKKVFTIDVIVYADARELTMHLRQLFPTASLKVMPLGDSVLISGYVDQPEHVDLIVRIAKQYYGEVINNVTLSGVQQVLLHVKVMEVSRTKLRTLGFDFSKVTGDNLVVSSISGLITAASTTGVTTSGSETFYASVVDGSSAFFGVLEALRQDSLLKILAEPNLVTVSGRPAFFNVGGEFPILVPQSLGTVSIEYKKYGTQLDFVPIVLGNGRIRLEVRPRVSEIDTTRGVTLDSVSVPALRTREVETGVELQAGQTLAIAGLVQTRSEAQNRGLPWISEVPYLGALFRKVEDESNEIELLILVTPELADAMDAEEVPQCGPGQMTTIPSDWELYLKGHLEVPNCCPPCYNTQPPSSGAMPAGMPSNGMILDEGEIIRSPEPNVGEPTTHHNRYNPHQRYSSQPDRASVPSRQNGLVGAVGYDVLE